MVNDILYGISTALNAEFPQCPIYTDTVEQGLVEPCFFVLPISSSESRLLGNRAYRNIAFDVHYISKEKRLQLEDVACRLYVMLRQIKLLDGSLLNGFGLSHEIIDGVLHFFVSFKPTILYKTEDIPSMGNVTCQVEVKDEES